MDTKNFFVLNETANRTTIFLSVLLIIITGCSHSINENMKYQKIIKQYYNAFKDVNKEALQKILTEDFNHKSSYAHYTNRDSMIEEIWPTVGKTWADDIQIFGTYPEFMVRYKVVGGERPEQNMSEYILFQDDKIAEIEVFTGRELK